MWALFKKEMGCEFNGQSMHENAKKKKMGENDINEFERG
jgi:Mor family transcriptional regulator